MLGAKIFHGNEIMLMENLGNRVAQARAEKGWDQKRLSKEIKRINPLLKTGPTTISSIENGQSKKPTILYELAKALGVTEHWLKTGKQPKMRAAGGLMDKSAEEAVTALMAGFLGVLQAFEFSPEEADELARIAREAAEEPLTGESPAYYERARRILAASQARKFLILKDIKLSRA
jgi:transcriptional regulator with XRE-family HTH domain